MSGGQEPDRATIRHGDPIRVPSFLGLAIFIALFFMFTSALGTFCEAPEDLLRRNGVDSASLNIAPALGIILAMGLARQFSVFNDPDPPGMAAFHAAGFCVSAFAALVGAVVAVIALDALWPEILTGSAGEYVPFGVVLVTVILGVTATRRAADRRRAADPEEEGEPT